ncbi:MAG: HlyD family efflux transporter periplasmic adaptor subunit [Pseudobutyrivibrio sp.]|nr:HlyD family efflux transporter periplasmic adaptor subunit [Pseudobutyrivibrio sp.]
MKKLKPIIITIVIIGIVAGGLFGYYKYNQGKKVAQVVSMQNEGMDGYWGDSIQSYGTVTSDKAQSAFIASGTEIISVNVAEGDHVEEGDVLMVVKKQSQDINGKILQIQKAEQGLKVEQLKLTRLENTTPSPEYMHSQYVYRDDSYISERHYVVTADSLTLGTDNYNKDDIVAITYFSSNGESQGTTYYKSNGRDEETDETNVAAIKDAIEQRTDIRANDITSTNSWLASIIYYDGETGKAVGEDDFDQLGNTIHDGKPTGPTPSELKRQIETQSAAVMRQDLEYRKLVNELDVMKNTTDNGEILAKVSGTVSKCQSMDNYNNTQPFMVVSATDEYFISGSVGEFYLDSVHVGDTVTISSWESGATADAVITSISDTPSTDSNFYGGNGNSNSSNYEFKASFDRNSGIEIGAPVDIQITPAGQEQGGFYIPSMYIRKDGSGSYVMKMNENNQLERVPVKVGKSLWGYMSEIKEGVTMDDYLAFPYGNGAIEGVTCEVVDYIE